MILLVAYDLHEPGQNYDQVSAKLKSAGALIDEFVFVKLVKSWASSNVNKPATDWLKSAGRRW